MSYAIIETGGKQLRVEPGRFYDIELLPVQPEQSITINSVLLVQHNGDVTIGQPFVEGATVEGTVMRHYRGRKVIVYKMKPKKKTRKKRGHRQEITRLMINSISMNGSILASTSEQIDETPAASQTPAEAPTAEEPAPEVAVTEEPTAEAPTTETSTEAPTAEESTEVAPTTEESAEASTSEESTEVTSQQKKASIDSRGFKGDSFLMPLLLITDGKHTSKGHYGS